MVEDNVSKYQNVKHTRLYIYLPIWMATTTTQHSHDHQMPFDEHEFRSDYLAEPGEWQTN